MTSPGRWLIVNADDFGQTDAINRGVFGAFEHGIVTSASLMVRWPASREAAEYARRYPAMSLGLHVDLGEWSFRDETWVPVYQVADTADERACWREIENQLQTFRGMTGTDPTHLDSHQHVHREEPLRGILMAAADSLEIPLRSCDPRIRYDGSFYGQSGRGYPLPQAIEVDHLVQVIDALPPGVTELGCHPGEPDVTSLSMYSTERAREVHTLCDARVRQRIESAGVRLCSFHQLRQGGPW